MDIPNSAVRLRNNIIKKFYENNICDVYGRSWYGKWSLNVKEETRSGHEGKSWGQIKVEHSRDNYNFSICIENSIIKNYCTEKFAQAIESHLIPIYCFGNGLEDYFDTENAVEVFSEDGDYDFDKAISVIVNMTFDEYYSRIRALTDNYNKIISQTSAVDFERNKPAKLLVRDIILSN